MRGLRVGLVVEAQGLVAELAASTMESVTSKSIWHMVNSAASVSRPFLIKLLETGAIPHRKVGAHRRILTADVIAYKQADDEKRNAVLDELAAEAQTHGLGY